MKYCILFLTIVLILLWMAPSRAASDHLVDLYGQAVSEGEAKELKQRLTDNPKLYLYWYGTKQGLEQWEIETFDRIIECESHWVATAKNPNSSAAGLLQFIASTAKAYGLENPYDPHASIRAGIKLYQRSGFFQWECY